uniref:Protein FAR-RED ELONGATED HYPOCOTYL 3-like n=1 Tax=Cucumis melo TaxID=3656 RepID=A0A9I9EJ81_CUCME
MTNDNDVKWVYHIITSNVERHIALIVHYVGLLSICLGSSSSSSFQTQIHDDRGRFFENMDMSKVDSNFALKVQDMFSTKSLFKKCVQVIALRDNFQYVTMKSNNEVMILQCVIENCKWSLHASCSIYGDRSIWVLTRFDSERTCSVDFPLTDHRQATFTVIKDLIKNKIFLAGSKLSTPKDIVHFICGEHGLSSVIEYKVDAGGRFLYFFMTLSASISGCQHCRLVISINETSLKNKYDGTLLSASTPDSNDHIFPLAFCVVDSENDSSWTWFCNQLKRIIGERNDVVIVSDRHRSICKAIKVVFSNILHCICLVHLL